MIYDLNTNMGKYVTTATKDHILYVYWPTFFKKRCKSTTFMVNRLISVISVTIAEPFWY